MLRDAAQSIHPNPTHAAGKADAMATREMKLPRTVAVVTLGIIGILHAQRLLSALVDRRNGGDHSMREVIIALLAFAALYLFWKDMQKQKLFEGMLKLLVILGVANILLPSMWRTSPVTACSAGKDDDEDEEVAEAP